MSFYRISVQRWLFMRTYRVVHHFWNDDETRLSLVLVNGDVVQLTGMDRRRMVLHADYRVFQSLKEQERKLEAVTRQRVVDHVQEHKEHVQMHEQGFNGLEEVEFIPPPRPVASNEIPQLQ